MKAHVKGIIRFGLALVWGLAVLAPIGQADTSGSREEELLQTIQALEERVRQLEEASARLATSEALEERVTKLEVKAEEAPEAGPNDFRVYWKDGLRFDSQDGRTKLKLGGRIQNDWAWFDDGHDLRVIFGDTEDGTEFRRARLYLSGTFQEHFSFKAQYDFAPDGDSEFKDVWMAMDDIPYLGQIKVGHFKEPFSLEELTSSKYITFMERALPVEAFAPSRNTGVQVSNAILDERMTWAVGIFRNTADEGEDSTDGGYNLTARVTGLPWFADDGRKLLHLGLAYSHRNIDDSWRFRARPEAHLAANRYVDTGSFYVDNIDMWDAELALVLGPFSVQSEYVMADVDSHPLSGSHDFDGWYAQASWFLTGENRAYKKEEAAFDKVKPKNNFSPTDGGWGAWELALRYSTVDLDDFAYISGGEEENWTMGLNWYLNPNLRIMLNYVRASIDHVLYDDDLEVLETRFQVAF